MLQVGLVALGWWGLFEALVWRVYEIDEQGIRFFKHGTLKQGIPLNQVRRISFFMLDAGANYEEIRFESDKGKPIKVWEEKFIAKMVDFDHFAQFIEYFCKYNKISFHKERNGRKISIN